MNLLLHFFKKYYLPCFIVIAVINYAMQKMDYTVPVFINNYGNDFLLLPIVLGIIKHAVYFVKRDVNLKVPVSLCVTITLFYTVLFEIVAPYYFKRYTADIWDIVAYVLGLFFFFRVENYFSWRSKKPRL